MKKILLLAMLLSLMGCGDNNQSDTSQSNSQINTLQKAEASPAVANYSLAASPSTMGAVAPLQGWNVTKSTVMGASTLIDAVKDSKISAALVSPNAKQVAEVLRGGAAGIALSIAVDQLLGAVDWVMDPENNRIRYTVPLKPIEEDDPSLEYYYFMTFTSPPKRYATMQEACIAAFQFGGWVGHDIPPIPKGWGCYLLGTGIYGYGPTGDMGYFGHKGANPIYNPKANSNREQYLYLETVAEKVISNADAGSLDAQVATNIAAQNILNDVVQAAPVVQELENNASEKCDENTNPSCKKECDPPAGVKFNKVTHFERHGRDPDINVGSHGCMAKTGSPVHWHYDVNHQLPDGRCFLKGHNFGGCGVAP